MAGVALGRDAGALQRLTQERNDAVGVQALLAQMPPAVNAAKHRAAHQRCLGDPVDISLHRAQLEQRRRLIRLPEIVAIALAAWQIQGDAAAGVRLHVLDLQTAQLITAKAAPEAQQNQRPIAIGLEQLRTILILPGATGFLFQPVDHLLQIVQLQRFGLFFLRRMQCANAFEHFAHHWGLGRIGKTLTVVPLRQR